MRLKWFPAALVLLITIPLIFWACESEDLAEPNPNIYPETFISEISPGVTTLMAWYGTDVDGRVERFEYKWDDGEWVETATLSETFPVGDVTNPYADFEFADVDEQRTFYVRAIDNNEGTDHSPAMATMSPNTIRPETQILEGPMTGSVVGPDVKFKWDGVDKDGSIDGFEWTLDDVSSWTAVEEYVTEKLFIGLAEGGHVFYVRAVDDLGAVDQTPAQSAFEVASGFKPKLANLSPVSDGGGWFSGVDLALFWAASVDYYMGQLPTGAFSYAFDDSTNFDAAGGPLASGWMSSTSYTIPGANITDGDHVFYIKARDISGNVDYISIGFGAAPFAPTKDLLLLDDFSWTPGCYTAHADIATAIGTGFLNGVTYDTRDVDDEGASILTPALLGQYKAVIDYSDGGFNSSGSGNLFAAYAGAGGSLMLTGYNLVSFGAPSITTPFGIYGGIFGTFSFPSNGLTGVATGGMLETADLYLPVPAACAPRTAERVYADAANTEGIFVNDSPTGDNRSTSVVASMNSGGNYVILVGQSIAFWDQSDADVVTFGNRVMALFGVADTDNP